MRAIYATHFPTGARLRVLLQTAWCLPLRLSPPPPHPSILVLSPSPLHLLQREGGGSGSGLAQSSVPSNPSPVGTGKLSPKADERRLRETESGPSRGVQLTTWWPRGLPRGLGAPPVGAGLVEAGGAPALPRGSAAVSLRSRRCHLLPAALRKPFIRGQLLSLSRCHHP